MQMRKLAITLFCLLPMAALLYGCGSSSKSGGSINNVTTVGDTACIQCHGGRNIEVLTGEDIINQYKASSPHQNSEHANNGNGCEACHGNGGQHNGVGPIAFPNPYDGNGTRCADCHKDKYATNAPTHFAESRHAKFEEIHMSGSCARCHTHEGALLSNKAGITGEAKAFDTTVNPTPVYTGAYSAFKCSTCHEHGGGLRSIIATTSTGTKVAWNPSKAASADAKNNQFNLCTSCHVLYNYDGSKVLYPSNYTATTTDQIGGRSHGWHAALVSTHYDNPATAGVVEGYNIRKTGGACFDCHGHEAKTSTAAAMTDATKSTIHTDWAQSAHAGGLLANKYDAAAANPVTASRTTDPAGYAAQHKTQLTAVLAAGADTTTGIGWTYYNWDDSASRASCQRCHTATGAANYLSDPATYDPANNSFTHLSGWTTTNKTSQQQEVLYCWGCHDNAGTGSLRKPGAITANYTGNSYTYPDAKASNACISCHSGRETGESVKAATGDFSNKSFINSHYLTAGGTVFGNTGYHYTNRDYSIPAGDTHVKIGMGTTGNAAVDAAAKNGPCAACHFGSKNGSHKLKPYTVYSATDTSINPLCINCHSTRGEGTNSYVTWLGDDATAATFTGTTHKARYQAGLEALRVLLQDKGYTFTAGYPYFAAKNWLSAGDTDTTGNVTGKNNMGAAFNYNLLIHDPGGVAHNRRYTRRLIYDAMDWLDNNQLDYSVSATLAALPDPAYKAAATAYLINAGTGNVNLGTPNERH